MSLCNLTNVGDEFLKLVSAGLTPEEATDHLITIIRVRNNKDLTKQLNDILPDEKKLPEFTEADADQLASVWSTISDKIDDAFIKKIDGTKTVGQIIIETVGSDTAEDFFNLLAKRGIDLRRREFIRYVHIEKLQELVKIHRGLGDEEMADKLESMIELEQDRLEKRKQNADNKAENIQRMQIKDQIIQSLLMIADNVDKGVITEVERIFSGEMEDYEKDFKKAKDEYDSLVAKQSFLRQKWKAAGSKADRFKFKKEYTEWNEKNKAKLKDLKKKAIKAFNTASKKKREFILKEYKDRTGKTLSERGSSIEKVIFRLQEASDSTRASLIDLGLSTFVEDTREIGMSLNHALSTQARLTTIATEGFNIRVNALLAKSEVSGVSIQMAEDTFGKTAVNLVLKMRPPITLPDGTIYNDLNSDFTEEEINKAGQIWKSQLLSSYDGTFFSEDPGLISEEAVNTFEALALGRGMVDSSSPEAVDPTFAPGNLPEERLLQATPGEIPEKNKFKTSKEAVRALESTIKRLYSVFGFKYFDGVIPEKLIRQVLHSKLMDLDPKAWSNARVEYLRPRQLTSLQPEDRANFARELLRSLGGDPSTYPEFVDPVGWSRSRNLISFDIEAFGTIHDPDNKVDGVYCVQLHTVQETGEPRTEILVNYKGTLVDAKTVPAEKRSPLTPEQLDGILQRLEEAQNKGFKVLTHNGNNYDFPELKRFVTDKNRLARVSLRSIDLLANITSAMPETNWQNKQRHKGKKLKELASGNLPDRASRIAYGGRVKFTKGYPVDLTTGNEIRLDPTDGITPLWDEANLTGDWYKFDAYSENDADITIGLYLQMTDPTTKELFVKGETEARGTTIPNPTPKSNLFLNNDSSISSVRLSDSIGALKSITPAIQNAINFTFFDAETGYDANKVLDIFQEMWLRAVMQDPDANESKIITFMAGLRERAEKETVFDSLLVGIAEDNQNAIKPILEKKFEKFGYVLSLNYKPTDRNEAVVIINDPTDDITKPSSMPTGTFNEDGLYIKRTDKESPIVYENAVITSFLAYILKPEINKRFQKALKDRINPPTKEESEANGVYYKRVLTEMLKDIVPGFTSLSQFGNAELDWKPADEVGIALAQLILDQKPDISVVDTMILQGDSAEYIFTLDEQQALKNGGIGRRKWYGMPTQDRVSMIQPHSLIKEEKAYDGFRYLERIKHILDMDINETNIDALNAWLVEPMAQDKDDPISFFVKENVLRINPEVALRSPFSTIPDLKQKMQLTHEHLYSIPRLLMSINHDCFYLGISAPTRFLRDDLPVYYLNDAVNPGGPTAAATIGGAIDQLAWMFTHGMMAPSHLEEAVASIDRGIDLVVAEGPKAMMRGNKADYKYQGKHNIAAMLLCYNTNSFTPINDILNALGATAPDGTPGSLSSSKLIVKGSDLGDPRYIALDILLGTKQTRPDGTEYRDKGFLEQIIESPDKFKLDRSDAAVAKSLGEKLLTEYGTGKAKELLKGAVTPAMYQAGYPGILTGLKLKNEEAELDLTDEEIELLAYLLAKCYMDGGMRLIDKAIGFSQGDVAQLKEYLKNNVQKMTGSKVESILAGPKALKKAEDAVARKERLKQWLSIATDSTVKGLARLEGIEEQDRSTFNKFKTKTKDRVQKEWDTRLEAASEYWAKNSKDDMSGDEYNNFIYEMNVRLAGGDEAAKQHLMIFGLNQRAATPYVLQEESIELQKLVMGVHIDTDDYSRWLNREVYFRYAIETASGRNHMVGWYGLGPESSKYAQPRVLEGSAGDINRYGLWDIKEIPDPTNFEKTFLRQVLMDLARFYVPPKATGYNKNRESRASFFEAVNERSPREIVATEVSRYIENMAEEREFGIGDTKLTVAERNNRMIKAAGNAAQRARIRTKFGSEASRLPIVLDQRVDGIGALRPMYADIDFTQRGIYSLAAAQHRLRIKENRAKRLIESARETEKSDDPNNFVDRSLRGYVSPWTKENMPMIMMSTDDILGSLTLGENSGLHQKAIMLQNQLTYFARTNGLDSLLEKKDWARLYIIKRLREKALQPAIKALRKVENLDARDPMSLIKAETSLKEARIKYYDGFVKVMGLSSVSLSGKKRYSTIDLMMMLDERTITLDDIYNIKLKYGETPGWLQVLSYFASSGKIERLMPLKFGITIDPGVIARGQAGRVNIPETSQIPITSFGREILHIYNVILNSKIAREVATEMIKGTALEKSPGILYDSNGFVIVESLDPTADKVTYQQIFKAIIQERTELAKEMFESHAFVLNRANELTVISRDGNVLREDENDVSLTLQGVADYEARTATQVDNPSTLWLFTPNMIQQLLNNLENYTFIHDVELALQTNKELYGIKTDLDVLVQEEQAQLFESLRDDEEEVSDAIMFLHTLEPGTPVKFLEDYRKVDSRKMPKRVLDIGSYLRKKPTKEEKLEGKEEVVNIEITTLTETEKRESVTDIGVHTVDMPYVSKILEIINKARSLGFHEQAEEISQFLKTVLQREVDYRGVTTSNIEIKLAVLAFETYGNPTATDNVYRFFNFKNPPVELRVEIQKIARAMNYVVSTAQHETDREYYIASSILEKMDSIPSDIMDNKAFIDSVHLASERKGPIIPSALQSIKIAVMEYTNPLTEKEISLNEFSTKESPDIFVDPDNFALSFANARQQVVAEQVVNHLDSLVASGVISSRVRDLQLMMLGRLCQTNPDFIDELGFEYNTGANGESLMSASKRAGKYIIGLNITALKTTPENEILVKFAEELVHIARVKFIKHSSVEWQKVVGMCSSRRAEGMIREMLIAMNQGKPYDDLEKQVQYCIDNPDEWFAHIGAFMLLKEVMGDKEALERIQVRYKAAGSAEGIWKRAFYRIKGIAKQILKTFTSLRDNPQYSDMYADAETIMMSLFGNSMVDRKDQDNPDAFYNAYKSGAVVVGNKLPTAADRVTIQNINTSKKAIEAARDTELAKGTGKYDEVLVKSYDAQIETLTKNLREVDSLTYLGVSVTEVQDKMDEVRSHVRNTNRRLTERDLLDMGARRTFVANLVVSGMDKRGVRVDTADSLTAWTLGGLVRRIIPENVVSGIIQNGALNSFNGAEFLTNSPFAPMMVITDLIDQAAATTNGSLQSNVGGISNNKYAIDAYAHNTMRLWSEVCARHQFDTRVKFQISRDVIRAIHGEPIVTTDPVDVAYINNIADSYQLMNSRISDLMIQTQMKDPGDKLDSFPVKLRNFSLLSPEAQEQGYTAIRDALQTKHLTQLKTERENSPFSPLAMFMSSILPFETNFNDLADIDKKFMVGVLASMRGGPAVTVTNGREALLNFLIRKAAIKAATNPRIGSVATYANVTSLNDVFEDVQNELKKILYAAREGNLKLSDKDAFQGMHPDHMNILVDSYILEIERGPSTTLKTRFNAIRENAEFKRYFNMPDRKIPLLPESWHDMRTSDMLALDFLSKCGVSSHLFRLDSFHLTSKDIFVGNSAILHQVFDWHIDSTTKSLARGTGYDLIERVLVQQMCGIPGAYFNITQILNMMEAENESGVGASSHNFHLLDANGVPVQQERSHAVMHQAITRARYALAETRGTLSKNDIDQGYSGHWLNSRLKEFVALRFGVNINTATALVEGGNGVLAQLLGGHSILDNFMGSLVFGGLFVNEFMKNKLWSIRDRLPAVVNKKLKFSPLRTRPLRDLAGSSMWTTEEALSPMLPNNLHHTDATSELIEQLSWWQRFMLRRSRANSSAMYAVRVAADAMGNREVNQWIRNGTLDKFSKAYNALADKPKTIGQIRELLKTNKIRGIDQEQAVYIIRAGLLDPAAIEGLRFTRGIYGSTRGGIVLDQNMARLETDLHFGRYPDGYGPGKQPLPTINGVVQTPGSMSKAIGKSRIALAKFMDMNTQRTMVIRKAVDAPAVNSLASDILLFYKSYPALYVAQQMMRRGSINSGWKMGIQILITGMLDLFYNILLALARGALSLEDVEEKLLTRPSLSNVKEFSKYFLRHPVFSNNPLGLVTNAMQTAISGKTAGGMFTSVGEAAAVQELKDLKNFIVGFWDNDTTWSEQKLNTYKALGPVFLQEMYGIPVRLMVHEAWGSANTNSGGPRPSDRNLTAVLSTMNQFYDGDVKELIKILSPEYPANHLEKQPMFNGINQSSFNEYSKRQKQMKKLMPVQQEKPIVPKPTTTTPTETKTPSLSEQATTPIKAPM